MNAHNHPDSQDNNRQTNTAKATPFKDLASTVAANTVALGVDYFLNGGPYGIALVAEANVKKPTINALLQAHTWSNGYAKTWSVLKGGFYPTFLCEVFLSEASKQLNSANFSHHLELFMPTLVGMGTAPAISLAAINERYGTKFDLFKTLRSQGVRGAAKLSAGATPIGVREGLCYYALHHDSSSWAKQIAAITEESALAFLFHRQNGEPSLLSQCLAAAPDATCVFVGQPLTVLAVNAAITKYQFNQHANDVVNNGSYLRNRISFWQAVHQNIVTKGQQSGLSPLKSYSPGIWLRTLSLFGTVGVFKTCLEPTKEWIQSNITHNKR